MRPISEAAARVTGQSFSRKYVSLGRILACWREIVGEALAGKAQPVKITVRKSKNKDDEAVILDIAAGSADATLLHYQKDLILERINRIFGNRWITAIRFVSSVAKRSAPLPEKIQIPLTDAEKNHLSGMLKSCNDAGLKAGLEKLGRAIHMEEKNESNS